MSDKWYVYIIKATDERLYTGITVDIKRRWDEHCGISGDSKKGAKFFRGRKPESLLFLMEASDRSAASKQESAIKKLKREQKILLISSDKNRLAEFTELLALELPNQKLKSY